MSGFEKSAPCEDHVRDSIRFGGKIISLMVRIENIDGLGFEMTAWNTVKRSQTATRIQLNEKDVDAQLELEKDDEFKGASSSNRLVQSTQSMSQNHTIRRE